MLKSKSAKVSEQYNGQRFDLAAVALFEELSRKKIKAIMDSGGAYLNKKRISVAKTIVKTGDKIEVFWEERSEVNQNSNTANQYHLKNNTIGTFIDNDTLIFENEDFFVINKPAGIASQATLASSKDTIFHALASFDSNKYNINKMFLVHRLDKDTSGLMLIAKNKIIQKLFEDLFRDKKIKKTYSALCFYKPKKLEGEILFPIAKDNSRKNCYFAITNSNSKIRDAKSAETSYLVKKIYKNDEASLIECFPKTGRTHQIRVHLSAIGCPLFGDKTYSQNIYGHRHAQVALRHMLHASSLSFEINNENFEFTSTLPEDFQRIIKILEGVQ
jgi:23S rRNA pseudouridine1911/1915/1917 synthase